MIIDPTKCTKKKLEKLGCRKWDESGLMLIPPGLLPKLREGSVLTSINGKKAVVGKDDIDMDTRYGLLAFGIFPTDKS